MDENPYQSPLTRGEPQPRRAKPKVVHEHNDNLKAAFIALAVFLFIRVLVILFR